MDKKLMVEEGEVKASEDVLWCQLGEPRHFRNKTSYDSLLNKQYRSTNWYKEKD